MSTFEARMVTKDLDTKGNFLGMEESGGGLKPQEKGVSSVTSMETSIGLGQ